jgi:hypothetical protein
MRASGAGGLSLATIEEVDCHAEGMSNQASAGFTSNPRPGETPAQGALEHMQQVYPAGVAGLRAVADAGDLVADGPTSSGVSAYTPVDAADVQAGGYVVYVNPAVCRRLLGDDY